MPTDDKDVADVLASSKAYLDRTKASRAAAKPLARTTDIELANESGIVDPTIASRQQVRKEQPRNMTSNIALRRSLTGGRR